MDLTVLDIGLRNHQISSVHCFFKIQTETFALRHSSPDLTDKQRETVFEDWKQVFTKLNNVISANISDSNSSKFAICLARIGFQSSNHLLQTIEKSDFNDIQYKQRFKTLFMQNIRSLRAAIKLSNVEESNPCEEKPIHPFDWDKKCSQTTVLSDALRANCLVLGQFWLKKYQNIDNNWNLLIRKLISFSLKSLLSNDFEDFKNTLCQSGIELEDVIHNIYVFTSDYRLRQLISSKFNDNINLVNERVNENMSEIISKIDRLRNETNISLTIDCISRMTPQSLQRSFFLSSNGTNDFDKNILSPNIVWSYLVDRNDCISLNLWIQRLEAGFESNTFPFNWKIRDDMIEAIGESASLSTREVILNSLAIRGCFCSEEGIDFQKVLNRFGRSDSSLSGNTSNGILEESLILSNSSLKIKEFLNKLIEYLCEHNLNDFLYIYYKNFSKIPIISDNPSINLLKSSILCYEKPSNEKILENILLSAQYVYSLPNPVTIKSLFENNYPYLGLICGTYSTTNISELLSQTIKTNDSSEDQLVINCFKSHFPIFFSSFAESSKLMANNTLISEAPTLYTLLMDSIPFDVSKMFCWQSTNNLVEPNDNCSKSMVFSQLPHFSNTSLADLYGLKANLSFTYYLNEGRVIEAYNQFISNRKSLNSKSIGMAGRRAALVAYNDTNDIQIAVSSVIFQQLLNEDSTQTLVHLSVANIIMSFAADFLSLNPKLQQIELSNLLKRSHYYSDKRAATKLLQLTVAAITRKYKNYMNIQIEECLDWNIVIRFATLHSIELPLDLLTKCAASDNWLLFTLSCQLHQYPKELVLAALKNFNNECISDHLSKAFQSSNIILADNESGDNSRILNRKQSQKRTTKHLRNVLYSRIGLNRRPEPIDSTNRFPKTTQRMSSSIIESDDQSIASETDYNGVETISVISSSNASDGEEMAKLDPENCPKDLFQIILSFQTDPSIDVRKALIYSSIPLSNPILCLIASSADYGDKQKLNFLSCFSSWLLASVDFSIRKQFCERVPNLDPMNWSLDNNYQLLDLIMRDVRNYWLFLRGLKLFSLNITVLINLLKFMSLFFCEKNYYNVQNLKAFQDSLWKYEEPTDTQNQLQSKEWIQRASVIILTDALRNAKSHELVILLRHYDFARIQDSFSPEIKVEDFRRLYRLSQCLIDTDIVLPISKLLSQESNQNEETKSKKGFSDVITSLQQSGHFLEARNFANIAEIESNDIIINEWSLRAAHNLNSFEFWEKCWDNLMAIDPSLYSGFKVFNKFLSQINSVVVKCFLIFKCLMASHRFENQKESSVLEAMLWKCIFQIERDINEKNQIWSRIWSDIIAYIKSNPSDRHITHSEPINISSSSEEFHKTMNKVMEKLFNNSCLEKSQEVSQLFNYNNPELDIVLTCDNMAKGLIKDLSEAPLSVQLKVKAIGKRKSIELSPHFSEEQKEIIGFLENIRNLSTIGRKACQRVLLYYKICCVLNRSYTEVKSSQMDDLELLKCLISVHSTTNDALSFAKELIALNEISDENIASIICKETLFSLKNSLQDYDYSRDNSFCNLVEMSTSFLSLIRLLNDTTILGTKLLNQTEGLSEDPNNNLMLTKLYIKAHECFSLACDVRGIALVLRKARLFITNNLLQLRDFKAILRLLTGIGRYSEMTYCFDLLKENNEFELLISKHIEKAPQLRIALLDYLKGDKELFPLVALRFCLYREIGENHERSAKQQFNDLKQRLSTNLINRKQELELIMNELIDAHESYAKAGCYSKGDTCGKLARLIALQIHYLPQNVVLINMNSTQIANFIENSHNFHEALIVAEAYDYNTGWVTALFNQFIVNNDLNYLMDYTSRRDISTSLAEELVNKYIQYVSQKNLTNDKLSQMKKSMQRLIQYIDDYETRFRIAVKLNFTQIIDQMVSEESGSYLQDLRRKGVL